MRAITGSENFTYATMMMARTTTYRTPLILMGLLILAQASSVMAFLKQTQQQQPMQRCNHRYCPPWRKDGRNSFQSGLCLPQCSLRAWVDTRCMVHGKSRAHEDTEKNRRCTPCPGLDEEEDDDDEMALSAPSNAEIAKSRRDNDSVQSRREAAYALVGNLWAVGLVPTAWLFDSPLVAHASGQEAKMVFPNPLESMNDRATRVCLVESLGNRECLVYQEDADKLLYKGADAGKLLERIERATLALSTIPELANGKRWSQISGVLTGPCGELIRTMGQVAALSEKDESTFKTRINQLKNDLYAMQAGVDRKDTATVLKFHQAATADLVAFIKSL